MIELAQWFGVSTETASGGLLGLLLGGGLIAALVLRRSAAPVAAAPETPVAPPASVPAAQPDAVPAPPPVPTAFNGLSLDEIRAARARLSQDAALVLDLCAWWGPDGLAPRLLTDAPWGPQWRAEVGVIGPDLEALCRDPELVAAVFGDLQAASLIGADGALHPIVSAALRAEQDAPVANARAAAAILAAVYPARVREHPADCARLTPHVQALCAAWPGLAGLPAVADAEGLTGAEAGVPDSDAADYLFHQAARYLRQSGHGDAAVALAEASLRLKRMRLVESHRDVVVAWQVLAEAYRAAGQDGAAVAVRREILRLSEDYGLGLEVRSDARVRLAQALREADADATAAEALQLLLAARDMIEGAWGPQAWQLAPVLTAIGETNDALGETYWAVLAAERALPLISVGDASYGHTLSRLGGYLLKAGRTAEASDRLAQALTHLDSFHAADHPWMVVTAAKLVDAHLVLGRDDAAEVEQARALADRFAMDWDACQASAAQYA